MRTESAFTRVLLCALLVAMPAMAQKPPQEVAVSYSVKRGSVAIAIVEERFEAGEQGFRISSETSAVGLFVLIQPKAARFTSSGRITERGLQPRRFEAGRGTDDPRRVSADFDWAQSRLTIKHDGREQTLALPDGTQDRLSAMYQFMFIDLENRRHVEIAMTNGRKFDNYLYTVTPGVEIDTALGRLPTLHLIKRRDPGETQAEIWLSPAHANLPVRMLVIEEDGARYEQTVTRLDMRL
jgi:hypothetical protein